MTDMFNFQGENYPKYFNEAKDVHFRFKWLSCKYRIRWIYTLVYSGDLYLVDSVLL